MEVIISTPHKPLRVNPQRTTLSLQNTTAPTMSCRCCGQHIESQWQPGSSRRAGYWLLTCTNDICTLYSYTFSAARYLDLDLSPYLEHTINGRRT